MDDASKPKPSMDDAKAKQRRCMDDANKPQPSMDDAKANILKLVRENNDTSGEFPQWDVCGRHTAPVYDERAPSGCVCTAPQLELGFVTDSRSVGDLKKKKKA